MKQGFLLKHLDMTEYNMEKVLIDKVVECKGKVMQFNVPAMASRTSTKTRSGSDTYSTQSTMHMAIHSFRIISGAARPTSTFALSPLCTTAAPRSGSASSCWSGCRAPGSPLTTGRCSSRSRSRAVLLAWPLSSSLSAPIAGSRGFGRAPRKCPEFPLRLPTSQAALGWG